MRPIVYVSPFVARWFVSILIIIPVVRWCSLIGPHWSPVLLFDLSLLMLWGWGLIWIASLTLRVYQWGSQSINLTLLQIAPPHRLMKTSSIEVETSRSTSKVNISWDKRIKFISFLIPRWTITTCTYFVKESDPRSNVHYLSSSSFFFFFRPYFRYCSSSAQYCEDHFHTFIHVFIRGSNIWLSYILSRLDIFYCTSVKISRVQRIRYTERWRKIIKLKEKIKKKKSEGSFRSKMS